MDDVSQPPDRTAQLVFAMVGGVMLLSLLFYALLTITRLHLAQPADASTLEPRPVSAQQRAPDVDAAVDPPVGQVQFEAHCDRSDQTATNEPFIVRATSVPSPSATPIVAVAIIAPDGGRIPHTLQLTVDGAGNTATGAVPDSAGQAYVDCVVTAFQLDGQVTITGQ